MALENEPAPQISDQPEVSKALLAALDDHRKNVKKAVTAALKKTR